MSRRNLKPVEWDLSENEQGKDLTRMFAASLSSASDAQQASMLDISHLGDNPYQPRTTTNEATLEELSRVIEQQGFQGVLVARPDPDKRNLYQLTAGHRRRDAAMRAGLKVLPVVVRELSDEEMMVLAITENIQRDDLTVLEEGRIYSMMQDEMGYKLEQIAREVGKSLGYVYNRVRVARAPEDVQALVEAKPDSIRAVANLIKVKDEGARAEMIDSLLKGRLTTDDLPHFIERLEGSGGKPQDGQIAGAGTATGEDPKRRKPATRPQPDYSTARTRSLKLSRIRALLQAFGDGVGEDVELGEEERLELARVGLLADTLRERFGLHAAAR